MPNEMNHCQMCGDEIPDGYQFCDSCTDWTRQQNEQMEREEFMREEYREEMRKDAFEDA